MAHLLLNFQKLTFLCQTWTITSATRRWCRGTTFVNSARSVWPISAGRKTLFTIELEDTVSQVLLRNKSSLEPCVSIIIQTPKMDDNIHFFSLVWSAWLARVAHFLFSYIFCNIFWKMRSTNSTFATSLFIGLQPLLHLHTKIYNVLQKNETNNAFSTSTYIFYLIYYL